MIRRLLDGCLTLLILALVTLAAAVLTRGLWLPELGAWLVVDQPPSAAEAIVAVSGEHSRRRHAADLYQRGLARFLIFNLSDTTWYFSEPIDPLESVRRFAGERELPPEAVLYNTGIGSTWEDALATRARVRELGLGSLIVVSSPFNMRRVALTYRRVFHDLPVRLTFCAVPPEQEKLSLERWWTRERELQLVTVEYLKILFYVYKYFL